MDEVLTIVLVVKKRNNNLFFYILVDNDRNMIYSPLSIKNILIVQIWLSQMQFL